MKQRKVVQTDKKLNIKVERQYTIIDIKNI